MNTTYQLTGRDLEFPYALWRDVVSDVRLLLGRDMLGVSIRPVA